MPLPQALITNPHRLRRRHNRVTLTGHQTNRIPLELLRKHSLRSNRLNLLLNHLSNLRWGIMTRPNNVPKYGAILDLV